MAPRLVVQVRDREFGAEPTKRLGAAIGDGALVCDADDERPAPGKYRMRVLDCHAGRSWIRISHAAWSTCLVWRAIISSSSVGTTQAEIRLSDVLIREAAESFAVSSSARPSH